MTETNRIWILMSRSLCKEATAEELSELSQLLVKNPDALQQFELLQRFWEQPSQLGEQQDTAQAIIDKIIRLSQSDQGLVEFEHSLQRKRRRKLLYLASTAACIASIAVISLFRNNTITAKHPGTHSVTVQYGNRSKTTLPDGSTVWLNAGSVLEYNNFTDSTRKVNLHGEGYFTVTHDSKRPFIVHTDDMDIRVHGTTFNVKSYPEDTTAETTLINGSVEVFQNNGAAPIFLKPNQKIIIHKKDNQKRNPLPAGSKEAVQTVLPGKINLLYLDTTYQFNEQVETSWVYNRLTFRGENFAVLAKKMERWYNATIVFTDPQIQNLRFYGSFENETLTEALEALQLTAKFKFKSNGNTVFISAD